MATQTHVTIGDIALFFGVQGWQARRAVDALGEVPRAGLYRLVPRTMLGQVEAELRRRGYIKEAVHAD